MHRSHNAYEHLDLGCSVVPPIGRPVSRGLLPAPFMHRATLRKAAAVGVIPRSGFRSGAIFVIACEILVFEGASPTPQYLSGAFGLGSVNLQTPGAVLVD